MRSVLRLLLALTAILAAAALFCPVAHAATRPDLVGSITDIKSGAPIAGATVMIYTARPRVGVSPYCPGCYADCGKTAQTNAKGAFRIASLSPSLIFRLLVVRDGFEPTFKANIDPGKGRVRIAFAKSSVPSSGQIVVQGKIVDETGAPVVGATVEPDGVDFVLTAPDSGAITGEFGEVAGMDPLAITDSHGAFELGVPANTAGLYVIVKARSLATQAVAHLKPGPSATNIIRMKVGTCLIGYVVGPNGRGIAGATVEIVPVDRNAGEFTGWDEIATQANGAFSLPNVVADTKCVVCVRMDSLASTGLAAPQRAVTTAGDNAFTDVGRIVVGRAATIRGRIVVSDGSPLPPGTHVMLGRDNTWDVEQTVAGADGSFAFAGVPQRESLGLNVGMQHYGIVAAGPNSGKPWNSLDLTIPPDRLTQTVTIEMEPVK